MVFAVDEKFVERTEAELKVKFPESYRKRILQKNGGQVNLPLLPTNLNDISNTLTFNEWETWTLLPVFDPSDQRRIRATSNDLLHENKKLKEAHIGFPPDALAIASNDEGNYLVFLKDPISGYLQNAVYFWDRESSELDKIADDYSQIERVFNFAAYQPQGKQIQFQESVDWPEMEKIHQLPDNFYFQLTIKKPWQLFKIENHPSYILIFGNKNNIKMFQEFMVQINDHKLSASTDDLSFEAQKIYSLYSQMEGEITRSTPEEIMKWGEFEFNAIFIRNQGKIPVHIWLYNPNYNWHMHIISKINRYKNDLKELEKLFQSGSKLS